MVEESLSVPLADSIVTACPLESHAGLCLRHPVEPWLMSLEFDVAPLAVTCRFCVVPFSLNSVFLHSMHIGRKNEADLVHSPAFSWLIST